MLLVWIKDLLFRQTPNFQYTRKLLIGKKFFPTLIIQKLSTILDLSVLNLLTFWAKNTLKHKIVSSQYLRAQKLLIFRWQSQAFKEHAQFTWKGIKIRTIQNFYLQHLNLRHLRLVPWLAGSHLISVFLLKVKYKVLTFSENYSKGIGNHNLKVSYNLSLTLMVTRSQKLLDHIKVKKGAKSTSLGWIQERQ